MPLLKRLIPLTKSLALALLLIGGAVAVYRLALLPGLIAALDLTGC